MPPGLEIQRDTDIPNISKRILNALHFREIADRRAAVAKAHKKTFQWVFQDRRSDETKWDNFSHWLRFSRGCYRVNGKSGSGKSTLMKYIQEDNRTIEALRE
jgi:ABC-type glutathione transport system ATPase component